MRANSYQISSSQSDVHKDLNALLAKHLTHPFQKPITDYNRTAFESSIAIWRAAGAKPLILDAACGVGLSTLHLATQFPDHYVIGVDQSADRIARNTQWPQAMPQNFTWVRADLVDYWRLLLQSGIQLERHYILYPNPWPKIGHLARRWHGHAIFPTIVALGGALECRSNWRIYIEEFSKALMQVTRQEVSCLPYVPEQAMTPFEQKYQASGHDLWCCQIQLA
ncbi:tRNA (guanine(46)-N(7))-methyltransferase TrmB [Herminiimonas fonticola]|uniref:tRNA (guanine(46)-N(7))-methyltransferase n=1 Tax=Herminiimonas fonticola TaxID=303380 RepID=A0A4R6GHJ7_9BURK|nr:methyltransferase domain-containing protein [Herminiimonas fonticola]RBA24448.1 putative methyltransferase [Herminiimonas fonticola]TDN93565.1 tRNA G46 methylase TrmB [Herminiimonas fonticola]